MATVGLRGAPAPATDDLVAQLEALYRVEYAGMVRLAYTLLLDNAEAEEIVQDSFVEVHRRWPELRKPGAYLRTTVVSRCRSNFGPPDGQGRFFACMPSSTSVPPRGEAMSGS